MTKKTTPAPETPKRVISPEEARTLRLECVRQFKEMRTKDITDRVAYTVKRIREMADDLERAAGQDYYTPVQLAERVVHDVLWLVPNLNFDGLMRDVVSLKEAETWLLKEENDIQARIRRIVKAAALQHAGVRLAEREAKTNEERCPCGHRGTNPHQCWP